jgi:hypothetical protein
MQIQDCGLQYRNISKFTGSGQSIQAVCVGNAWFDLSKLFWRMPDSNDELSKREYEDMIEIFSRQGQTRFADRVLSGVDTDSVYKSSMPFGNLYLLIDGSEGENVRVAGKVRLNCTMLPVIEAKERKYEFDSGTGMVSFAYSKVDGCVGSLLYQLVPVLFVAQIANQCKFIFHLIT